MAKVFKQISIGCLLITGSQLYECILTGNLSKRFGELYSSPMNKILPVKAWICIGIRDVKDFSCSCHLTSYSFFYRKSAENKNVCYPQYELPGKQIFPVESVSGTVLDTRFQPASFWCFQEKNLTRQQLAVIIKIKEHILIDTF